MNFSERFVPALAATTYFVAVLACISLAFDFAGNTDELWLLVLLGLTAPWSGAAMLFSWALFHGAGLGFFAVMFTVFAGMNAFVIYHLAHVARRYYPGKHD